MEEAEVQALLLEREIPLLDGLSLVRFQLHRTSWYVAAGDNWGGLTAVWLRKTKRKDATRSVEKTYLMITVRGSHRLSRFEENMGRM